jgi:formylglycine-generating enzyme required for sulfatase activity
MKKTSLFFLVFLTIVIFPSLLPGVLNAQTRSGFILVPGGSFRMGNNSGATDERPERTVTLDAFYMAKYPVTQIEWEELMMTDPSYAKGDNFPVENVNWFDAVEFCNRLSQREGLSPAYTISDRRPATGYPITSANVAWNREANGYRLPTEAEWEYAARGGNGSPGNFEYSGSNNVDEVAWHLSNSGNRLHEVGGKKPNALGLHDMSGNISEWCWDRYDRYPEGAQVNPMGPSSQSNRVHRGGSFWHRYPGTASTTRNSSPPSDCDFKIGFRIVRPQERIPGAAKSTARPSSIVGGGFVRIPGGNFRMNMQGHGLVRRVHISAFSMARYPVTQREWQELMGSSPNQIKGDNLPAANINWFEAVEFCNRLSQREELIPAYTISGSSVTWNREANGYRLPTEAEWEYAARGGNGSPGNFEYSGSNNVDEVAWYNRNNGGSLQAVGKMKPNALGLYDMSGNVYEWCWDWNAPYTSEIQTDPSGPASGSERILRGGSWNSRGVDTWTFDRRSIAPSRRNWNYTGSVLHDNFGFRLVRP